MYLLIAEKPELGAATADAIPGPSNHDKGKQIITKTWRGQPITIVWCFGHLLTLWDPEEYDEKYKQWNLEQLPFYFENWKHKPIANAKKDVAWRVSQIGNLLKQASTVIHAGDIDDEGQLLIDELLRYHNYRGTCLRLNTNDTSPAALLKALDNMDNNSQHISSGLAAFGRQLSDKTFGYNLTRYYSVINPGTTLSVGRVKMPTLGLVVQRDLLVENHKKMLYYTLGAALCIDGKTVPVSFVPTKDDTHLMDGKITDRSYLQGIAAQLQGANISNITITVSEQKEQPPLPFNLNKLYAYCANKFNLQPDKVLKITQTLREQYRAITYNRTDCRYLTDAIYAESPNTVKCAAANLAMDPAKFDTSIKSRCFNDAKVSAHTAIIPTGTKQDLSRFTQDEANVYTAIVKYYLAQFMSPAIKQVTRLEVPAVCGAKLTATSTVVLSPGYRELLGGTDLTKTEEDEVGEDEAPETESPLSGLKPGQYNGSIQSTKISEKETRPLPRYTKYTLIEDMSCIAKYVTNKAVKDLLLEKDKGKEGENGGIGTGATRTAIVAELIKFGYLKEETKGKRIYLVSTQLGREFYDMLPDSVRKVDVSAKWWCEQEAIRAGEMTPDQMAKDVLRTVNAIIQTGKGVLENGTQYAKGIIGGEPIGKCPKCGGDIYETSKGFKCVSDNCHFMIFKQDKFFLSLGKTLSAKAVQLMLQYGKLTVKNCKSKSGKTYDAVILCDFTSGDYPKYSFAQDDQLDSVGQCPKCGQPVVDKGKGFRCINKDCTFILWKSNRLLESIGKKALTAENAKALLAHQRCKLTGCKSKKMDAARKTYSCYYVVDFSQDPYASKFDFSEG